MNEVQLDEEHVVYVGEAPAALLPEPDSEAFELWWALRPDEVGEILMFGRSVATPRWQRAYGHDYRFSGQTSPAHPVPLVFAGCLGWAQTLDARLNGLLLNWYDAEHQHYIGPHRDSRVGLVPSSPIVTVSVGSARTFRLRPHQGTGNRPTSDPSGRGFVDLRLEHGTVVVLPWETNLAYTHEVPHFAYHTGRRISLTARAFAGGHG